MRSRESDEAILVVKRSAVDVEGDPTEDKKESQCPVGNGMEAKRGTLNHEPAQNSDQCLAQ